MRGIWFGVVGLLLLGAGEADAQCRRHRTSTGVVTVCDSDRERERARDRERDRARERERETRRRVEVRRSHGWGAGPVEFGVRGGYDFEDEGGTAGAQLRFPLVPQLVLAPSFDVFFGDDAGSEWQLNADAAIRPGVLGGLYFGGGAAFLNRDFEPGDFDEDSETEVGFNLFVGLDGGRISGSVVRPFVEGRWTSVDDYDAFRLAAGINVPISGRWR